MFWRVYTCAFIFKLSSDLVLMQVNSEPARPASPTSFMDIFQNSNQSPLISTRDIAELTQVATQFAAQTLKSNGELLSNSGPEVRPLSLNTKPSELLGQAMTNAIDPARKAIASELLLRQPVQIQESTLQWKRQKPFGGQSSDNPPVSLLEELAGKILRPTQQNSIDNLGQNDIASNSGGGMVGQALRFFSAESALNKQNAVSNSNGLKAPAAGPLPTLNQLIPGVGRNFGFNQGEGCVPFLGEFMKMAYGNCVKRADEKTWDTWGKEITNALTGGKIDFLRASKETCKMGAEREQCVQLRKAVSECDIMGSIQLASNLQRAIIRCDEVSGMMDQNPATFFNQINGLINGEVAQGFLNNFLG